MPQEIKSRAKHGIKQPTRLRLVVIDYIMQPGNWRMPLKQKAQITKKELCSTLNQQNKRKSQPNIIAKQQKPTPQEMKPRAQHLIKQPTRLRLVVIDYIMQPGNWRMPLKQKAQITKKELCSTLNQQNKRKSQPNIIAKQPKPTPREIKSQEQHGIKQPSRLMLVVID